MNLPWKSQRNFTRLCDRDYLRSHKVNEIKREIDNIKFIQELNKPQRKSIQEKNEKVRYLVEVESIDAECIPVTNNTVKMKASMVNK